MIVILFEMIFMIMRVFNMHFTNYKYVQMQMTIWNRENINPCLNTTANNVKCWIPKCCKPFVFYWDLNITRISLLETLKLMHYCYLLVVENMKLFVYWVSLIIHLFISNQYFFCCCRRVSVTLTMVCCTFGPKAFDFMDDLNPQWLKTI